MKKLLFLGALAFALASCGGVATPVTGVFYTNLKAPQAVGPASGGGSLKQGEAICTSYLGFVATGDCSLEAAMKAGDITEVVTVDYQGTSVMGFVARFKLIVRGR